MTKKKDTTKGWDIVLDCIVCFPKETYWANHTILENGMPKCEICGQPLVVRVNNISTECIWESDPDI